MSKYIIEAQRVAIGWKEEDDIGKPDIDIVEYDSVLNLLKGEGFFDENYDEENEGEFCRMINAVIDEGGFMCNEYERSYWHDPEPCDSYLTYGTRISIREVSDKEIAKIEAKAEKKRLANLKKWEKAKGNLTDEKFIEKLMTKYKFPKKLI